MQAYILISWVEFVASLRSGEYLRSAGIPQLELADPIAKFLRDAVLTGQSDGLLPAKDLFDQLPAVLANRIPGVAGRAATAADFH